MTHSHSPSSSVSYDSPSFPATPVAASHSEYGHPNGIEQQAALHAHERPNEILADAPGFLPESVYARQMSWWTSSIRELLGRSLVHESRILGALQARIRSPLLDKYFLYSSSLGTHMFFMTVLPCLFFFGHSEIGRGLTQTMCIGVYLTSLLKDLFCSPRPFAPPVTRLTIGTHHLEYGFPSTHSANSVSFAVYLYILLREATSNPESVFSSSSVYNASVAILSWYAASIVLGRLYCGMHSFTDVVVGTLIGVGLGLIQGLYGSAIESFIAGSSWLLPVGLILASLVLVNQHPQPIDDCPCFEDAIACLAVLLGVTIARWHAAKANLDAPSGFFRSHTPGWEYATPNDVFVWWSFALLKMVIGVCTIFAWRLLVKQVMHTVLPPTFRLASKVMGFLPTRRFYTPATEYESVPLQKGLHPIPSMMDLPSALASAGIKGEQMSTTTSMLPHAHLYSAEKGMKRRNGTSGTTTPLQGARRVEFVSKKTKLREATSAEDAAAHYSWDEKKIQHDAAYHDSDDEADSDDGLEEENVKHYDADVLTKFVVYGGIGCLASHLIPVAFELLGWGVLP